MLFHVENIVRYWIWWNDLIQGPFELDELTSLKAFSEDLPVCMEDREDWLPASRVADLSSAIEQLRARRAAPRVPPPSPPNRPPAVTPLQGEFFGESPGQQPLLDSEDGPKGPYAYRPVTAEPGRPASYLVGQATMPFHFSHPPEAATAVIEMLRPQPSRFVFAPPPVIKESPIPKPVEEPVSDGEKIERKSLISLELLQEKPSMAPVLGEPAAAGRKPEWLLWIMGVVLAVGALGTAGYWLMERASSHSAIAEANRLKPPNVLSTPASPGESKSNLASPTISPEVAPGSGPMLPGTDQTARDNTAEGAAERSDNRGTPSSFRRGMQSSAAFLKNLVSVIMKSIGLGARYPGVGNAAVAPAPPIAGSTSVTRSNSPIDVTQSMQTPGSNSGQSEVRKSPAGRSKRTIRKARAQIRHLVKEATRVIPKALHRSPTPTLSSFPAAAGGESIITKATPDGPPTKTLGGDKQAEIPVVESPAVAPGPPAPDTWKGRQNEAINLVVNKAIPKSKITIGSQARVILQEMHEKELLHAADTGERLYLPDKISWAALQEEGAQYRVYLNFLAWQANGERVQSRSYQFLVDLAHKGVRTEDTATQQDILTQTADQLNFKHNPMAVDIESILGGVDHYNKQKMRAIIVKNNRRNRNEQKNINAGMEAAKEKVTRAVVYFRRAYSDKILQNIAKAYDFMELLKG